MVGKLRQVRLQVCTVQLFDNLTDAVMQPRPAGGCQLIIQRGPNQGVRKLITAHGLRQLFDHPRRNRLLQQLQQAILAYIWEKTMDFLQGELAPED